MCLLGAADAAGHPGVVLNNSYGTLCRSIENTSPKCDSQRSYSIGHLLKALFTEKKLAFFYNSLNVKRLAARQAHWFLRYIFISFSIKSE